MSANQTLPEKRTNPRIKARIAIYHGPYQKKILTDYSINMSTGGVFIETNMILPLDTELTLKFNLANCYNIIVAKARVAWINDPLLRQEKSLPPGMGVQFLDLSIEDMLAIQNYIDIGEFSPIW